MSTDLDITFFVACLNEEKNVIGSLETVLTAVKNAGCSYEIIIVDDHSIDHSVQIIENYIKQNPGLPIRLIKNAKRQGLGRNYADVAFLGKGKYYKWLGASNMEFADDITAALKKMGCADMIIPYIIDKRGFKRRLLSMLFTKTINCITGYSLRYYNGSVLHTRYNVMRWHSYSYGYSFQAELIVRLLEEGAAYCEIPARCVQRESVKSKAFSVFNACSVLHSILQIFLSTLRRKLFTRP